MSERRGDQEEPEERPMLILGEDQPDVEDTTPDQLRALQAEQEQALAKRQREIDDAARQLHRTERRLRQQAERLGQSHQLPRASGDSAEPGAGAQRLLRRIQGAAAAPGIPRALPVIGLLGVGAVCLVVGTLITNGTPSQAQEDAFSQRDQARGLMLDSALQMDEEVLLHHAGQAPDLDEDGDVRSLGLATEAMSLMEDPPSYYIEDFTAFNDLLLATPAASEVRTLTSWQEARRTAGYSVSQRDIDDSLTALRPAVAGTVLLWVGGGMVALATLLLLLGGAWVAVLLTALALVPTAVLIATDGRLGGDFPEATQRYDDGVSRSDDVASLVSRDLMVAFGLTTLSGYEQPSDSDPGYWGRIYLLDDETEPEVAGLVEARSELGDVVNSSSDPAELSAAGIELVEEAEVLIEAAEGEAVQARDDILTAARGDGDGGLRLLALPFAVGLPALGFGAESVRRRRRTT